MSTNGIPKDQILETLGLRAELTNEQIEARIAANDEDRKLFEAGTINGMVLCMAEAAGIMTQMDEDFGKDGVWTVPGRFASHLIAAGFAKQLDAVGAKNFIETKFYEGVPAPFVVTAQVVDGKSPADLMDAATKERDFMAKRLEQVEARYDIVRSMLRGMLPNVIDGSRVLTPDAARLLLATVG